MLSSDPDLTSASFVAPKSLNPLEKLLFEIVALFGRSNFLPRDLQAIFQNREFEGYFDISCRNPSLSAAVLSGWHIEASKYLLLGTVFTVLFNLMDLSTIGFRWVLLLNYFLNVRSSEWTLQTKVQLEYASYCFCTTSWLLFSIWPAKNIVRLRGLITFTKMPRW